MTCKEYLNTCEISVKRDQFDIFVINLKEQDNPVLLELGRLRTDTYAKLGAGPKDHPDIDEFDPFYKHIIVWDSKLEEIVGSYRISISKDLFLEDGTFFSYSTINFNYSDDFLSQRDSHLELGRSFIQSKYWSGNFLDHLWSGLGWYLKRNPKVRYLYGTVSLGTAISFDAISIIMYFYKKWYWEENTLVKPKYPIVFSDYILNYCSEIFVNENVDNDLLVLKNTLKTMGYSIPVLLRKYFGMTEFRGTRVIALGEDPSFSSHSLMIRMDLQMVKEIYLKRYFKY